MATYKPLRIGDATRDETSPIRTFAADDTIETPLQVSQGGVVLGRITGPGAHQEILFADLPGGGAASIVEITYADMATALAGATLTPGQYYNITDAAGTDLGFVCLAVQADEITVSGIGGFTLTGGNEWDVCEFDFANNQLIYRSDLRGNIVRGADGVAQFPWGNDNVTGNFVLNGIINLTINAAATYANNTVYPGATISDITAGDGTAIENNILENGAQLTGITAGANCSISRNKVGQGATLGGSTTMGDGAFIEDNILESGASITDMQIDANVECSGNRLSAQSAITGINAFGSIYGNILGRGCAIGKTFWTDRSIIGISSSVSSNVFVSDGGLYDFILGENSAFLGNTVGASSGFINLSGYSLNLPDNSPFSNSEISLPGILISNIDAGHTFKKAQIGASSFDRSINITGLTTLDCLAENNYVGIFNAASSNATETINQIDNAPTLFPFQIRPAAGLVLTVTGTAYSGIAAGQIALTTTDVTLDGDKGEYLELEIDPLGTGALIERRRVAGIL